MVSIPWHLVLKDIQRRLRVVDAALRSSSGDDLLRFQGEARALEKMKDLPQSLQLTEEKEEPKDGKQKHGAG